MNIRFLLALALGALLAGWFVPRRWLVPALLLGSLLALYGLQPSTPIRNLDFWLPTASIALTLLTWAICTPAEGRALPQALPGVLAILCLPPLIALTCYLGPLCCLTPSRPPQILPVLAACLAIAALFLVIYLLLPAQRWLPWAGILLILVLFILLKSADLARATSAWLRGAAGQPVELAGTADLPWLGFSFLAFRLLHVLRDFQAKRLPACSLGEFAAYALFFPAIVSGPIDRLQHFTGELHEAQRTIRTRPFGFAGPQVPEPFTPKPERSWNEQALRDDLAGLTRILTGCLKKFVLADSLAVFALNAQNASQTSSTGWMWLLLLAYSLRIYFDFAGYSDIAIGMARLVGIRLPENFDYPYLKQNLTAFWNSWHITLSQWFRSYVFYPFTRALRTRGERIPAWLTILAGQFVTMALIGLWHGISWNFFLWGAWHGLGLFVQNRWSDWVKGRLDVSSLHILPRLALQGSGWLVTFLFVSLGWVWFALPTPQAALHVFGILL
jgi:D-alanyl-lipoteichoic acid acyltransferase DltB (MBOAT superfamily)